MKTMVITSLFLTGAIITLIVGANHISNERAAALSQIDALRIELNAERTKSKDLSNQVIALENRKPITVIKEIKVPAKEYPGGKPGTLAQKNNNCFNVKGTNWEGATKNDKKGHAVFKSTEYSVRATANVLLTYYHKHKISTIRGIVKRFCEGNQEDYIKFLCYYMHLKPDQKFNVLDRMPELLRYMTKMESGKWLPEQLFVGYDLIGKAYKKGQEKKS